jgi:hypothetical protein
VLRVHQCVSRWMHPGLERGEQAACVLPTVSRARAGEGGTRGGSQHGTGGQLKARVCSRELRGGAPKQRPRLSCVRRAGMSTANLRTNTLTTRHARA